MNPLPEVIAGLNMANVRARLGRDDAVLITIFRQFLRDFSAWPDRFGEALRQRNTEAMIRLVHTLKGTAANVGAVDVEASALLLENALRNGEIAVEPLLHACEQELQKVLDALRFTLPEEAHTDPQAMTPDEVHQVVGEVGALLQRRRHVPAALQQRLRAALGSSASPEQLEALMGQLAAFEFKKAQQTLNDLQKGKQQ